MRISPTYSHPNTPLITSYLLALTLFRSADHLPRTLRPCLPMRSYRHLLPLGRRQHRHTHRTRLGTASCRLNAPGIAPARLSFAEKPSSYTHPIPTPRRPPSRYLSYTTFTSYLPLSRARSRCIRISLTHSRPSAPLITTYLLALTSFRSADHLPRTLRPCLTAHSYRHLLRLGHRQHRRTRRTLLGTARCRSNAPGIAPARLRLAKKPPRTLAPS